MIKPITFFHDKESYTIVRNRLEPVKMEYRYEYDPQKEMGKGNIPLHPELGLLEIDIQSDDYWLHIFNRDGIWKSCCDKIYTFEDMKWEYPLVEITQYTTCKWRISVLGDTYNIHFTFTRLDGIILYEEGCIPECEFTMEGNEEHVLHIVLEWKTEIHMVNITETTRVKLPIHLQPNYLKNCESDCYDEIKRPVSDLKIVQTY